MRWTEAIVDAALLALGCRKGRKTGQVKIGTGSPGSLRLDQWGLMLSYAFGETAYQVGSSVYGKQWRDVDVRIVLEDANFDALFGGLHDGYKHHHGCTDPFWSAMMTAFSLWGQQVTGLPIDFQIHRRSDVTQADWDRFRQPLGIYPVNMPKPAWRATH